MMRVTAISFTSLRLTAFFLLIISNGYLSVRPSLALNQDQCANPLEKMVSAIGPTCTKGLEHLCSLFDKVVQFDEEAESDIKKLPIQRDLIWASGAFNETQEIAARHLQRYENRLISLTKEIADKQQVIRNDTIKLENLSKEHEKWQEEIKRLNQQLAETRRNLQQAEDNIRHYQHQISKRKRRRVGWIIATICTLGLAAPGLIINERDLQRNERDRDSYKESASNYQRSLDNAAGKLDNVRKTQSVTQQAMDRTKVSLSTAQVALAKLQTQDPLMKGLGVEIKKITTFLLQFQVNVAVINSHQKLLLLIQPLVESIDGLIVFLDKNKHNIILLAQKKLMQKIRNIVA